jgi:AcrR family transcriptional regulator
MRPPEHGTVLGRQLSQRALDHQRVDGFVCALHFDRNYFNIHLVQGGVIPAATHHPLAYGCMLAVICIDSYDSAVNRIDRRKQEVRDRILGAAFDLFLDQGVSATTIEDICERADVANRTFFNHFATRQDMMKALSESRLLNLHDVVFDRADEPIPARLIGVFDDIAKALSSSSDTYREVIAEMLAAAGYGIQRGFAMHDTFLELVKEGVARGEVTARHDAQTLADIIVGALTGGIVNWTVDKTYSLKTGLHDLAVALADLLGRDSNG